MSQRTYKEPHMVHRCWPWVWVKCCNCPKEFKWERGWVFDRYPGMGSFQRICANCAQTQEQADAIAQGWFQSAVRPPLGR